MTIMVLPCSIILDITSKSTLISSKCNPVVGSSRIYKVLPVFFLVYSEASLIR